MGGIFHSLAPGDNRHAPREEAGMVVVRMALHGEDVSEREGRDLVRPAERIRIHARLVGGAMRGGMAGCEVGWWSACAPSLAAAPGTW